MSRDDIPFHDDRVESSDLDADFLPVSRHWRQRLDDFRIRLDLLEQDIREVHVILLNGVTAWQQFDRKIQVGHGLPPCLVYSCQCINLYIRLVILSRLMGWRGFDIFGAVSDKNDCGQYA